MKKSMLLVFLFVSLFVTSTVSANEVLVPNVLVNSDHNMPFTLMNLHNASDTPVIVQGTVLAAFDLSEVGYFNVEVPGNGKISINSRDLLLSGRYENCEGIYILEEGEYVIIFNETSTCGEPSIVDTRPLFVDYLDVAPNDRLANGNTAPSLDSISAGTYRIRFDIGGDNFDTAIKITSLTPELEDRIKIRGFDELGNPIFLFSVYLSGEIPALGSTTWSVSSDFGPSANSGYLELICDYPCFVEGINISLDNFSASYPAHKID